MNKLSITIFLLLSITVGQLQAQKKNRIQAGKRYNAGEALYTPRYGFAATIPEGWEGLLPRESEVFMLTSTTATYGEIYVFARDKGNLDELSKAWAKGFDLSEAIRLRAVSSEIQGELLIAEVNAEGDYINKGYKELAVARCKADGGPCITSLMVAPVQFYEEVKTSLIDFMSKGKFERQTMSSPYSDFDWNQFLANKLVMTFASVQSGSKENMIHLCADGSFTANLKKKGIFKDQNGDYKGRQTGRWTANGIGSQGEITLEFNKKDLSPITAPLLIQDDNISSNGERYFVGQSDRCEN